MTAFREVPCDFGQIASGSGSLQDNPRMLQVGQEGTFEETSHVAMIPFCMDSEVNRRLPQESKKVSQNRKTEM